MLKLLDVAAVRQQLIDVDLGDGTCVRARKLDLSMMLLEGSMPMPLLSAARRLVERRGDDPPPEEQLATLRDEEVIASLRKHAALVVMDPPVVEVDDHDPTHLPVVLLTLPQLLAIWNQTAVLPKVGAAAAAEFRSSQRLTPPDAVRARQDVRPSPERLVEREYRGL